jgi:hypothetical protein
VRGGDLNGQSVAVATLREIVFDCQDAPRRASHGFGLLPLMATRSGTPTTQRLDGWWPSD